jgi:5-methylcytosine-specific restriction protein A
LFEVGRIYRRSEVHDEYGGQRQGGISTPRDHPIVLLVSGEEGASFGYDDDELDDGTLLYFGEGQIGDMSFTRGNLAIRDHAMNGEELHLFRKVREGYVRYRGQYDCAGFEHRDGVRDREQNPRRAIVFQLVPHEQLEEDELDVPADVPGVSTADLDALRRAALEQPASDESAEEARRRVYRRSRAVRRYVLVRADGVCEGCEQPAPFVRADGTPYLEAHHLRRRSDAGPDHPRWVAALCPTCHRRVHHGHDGEQYNGALDDRLARIEPPS